MADWQWMDDHDMLEPDESDGVPDASVYFEQEDEFLYPGGDVEDGTGELFGGLCFYSSTHYQPDGRPTDYIEQEYPTPDERIFAASRAGDPLNTGTDDPRFFGRTSAQGRMRVDRAAITPTVSTEESHSSDDIHTRDSGSPASISTPDSSIADSTLEYIPSLKTTPGSEEQRNVSSPGGQKSLIGRLKPKRQTAKPWPRHHAVTSITPGATKIAIPRQTKLPPETVKRHFCRVEDPCTKNKGGFARETDRNRHEVNLHPTVDSPSKAVYCVQCGTRLCRQDKIGEHMKRCKGKKT